MYTDKVCFLFIYEVFRHSTHMFCWEATRGRGAVQKPVMPNHMWHSTFLQTSVCRKESIPGLAKAAFAGPLHCQSASKDTYCSAVTIWNREMSLQNRKAASFSDSIHTTTVVLVSLQIASIHPFLLRSKQQHNEHFSTHQHLLAASAVLLPHPGTSGCRIMQLIATPCTCTSRKSIQTSTPLTEISVFIEGQGYSRPVSPAHGVILPNGQSQHTAIYSFTSAPLTRGRGKGGRRVRGNGRSDTEHSGETQIREFWVAGLLLQPFAKEKACSRKPPIQGF